MNKKNPTGGALKRRLLGGKLRRIKLTTLNRSFVEDQLSKRRGECARCSACCRFLFKCPFLVPDGDNGWKCAVHQHRSRVCASFPIDDRDIAERDLLMPSRPCGFSFDDDDGHTTPPDDPKEDKQP